MTDKIGIAGNSPIDRRRAAIELATFGALALVLRIAFDPLFWRFAGPVSLIATLACLAIYLRRRGEGWSAFGLIPLKGVKAKLMILPQVLLVFGFFAVAVAGILLMKRNLWPIVLVHGIVDTINFTALYLGAEG